MKSLSTHLPRRDFLRQACCAAVGSTGILSALAQLRVIGAVTSGDALRSSAAAIPSDYKALVCLFLSGGSDATSLVVPSDPTGYASYSKARADLAVAQSSLLQIAPRTYGDGRSYALHPSVPELHGLFSQGKIAVLANVGTLVQPTSLAQYKAGNALPPQLFSHSDQALQWQSSVPDRVFETGWGGRLGDLVDAMNTNNQISMAISLSGSNAFQRGNTVAGYSVSAGGVGTMTGGVGTVGVPSARINAIKSVAATPHSNLLAAAFGDITSSSSSNAELLSGVLKTAPVLSTSFPGTGLARSFAMIAKLIAIAPALGLRRQIFFIDSGGWDMHGAQASAYGPLIAELSAAMNSFYNATVELGVANQVTTFTASDFGRTYVPNAGGTDHAWGNHQLIMGGAVQGGDIYGRMPSLVVGADDDVGRGCWIPSTSVDEYNATLATWFGVSASNLPIVLPNIGRFAKPNLGFMG